MKSPRLPLARYDPVFFWFTLARSLRDDQLVVFEFSILVEVDFGCVYYRLNYVKFRTALGSAAAVGRMATDERQNFGGSFDQCLALRPASEIE
jgi:hypothetical protein